MTLVFPDGFRIEVSSEITYNQYNSIFNSLKGEWSYPFQIIGTQPIFEYFNYPNLPNVSAIHKANYENVSLYEGSYLIGTGTFTIIEASAKMIVANLNATAGNIPLKMLNKKLNTLDLGFDNLPTTLNKTGLYACLLSKFDTTNSNPLSNFWRRCTLILKVDNVQIWDYSFYISPSAYHQSGTDTIGEGLDANLLEINQDWADIGQPYELILSKDCINLIVKNNVAHNVQMTTRTLPNPDDRRTPSITRIYTFDRIEYNDINNSLDASLLDDWTKPYFFPTIINRKFYGDDVKNSFYGLINNSTLTHIETNDYLNRTKNVICPQFYLVKILRLILTKLEFKPTGSLFEANSAISKILILSLYALDKQANITTLPFNVHSESIKYANHLPNISILDFFKALIDEFGLGIDFNPLTKVVEFFFFKDILNNNPQIIDISNRISVIHKHKFEQKRHTQVAYNLSGDALAKEDVTPYISIPTKAIVDANEDIYEKLELKFPPLTTNSQGKIQIEAAGISPIFNQTNNESPLRFFFYDNKEAKSETPTLSLDLTKPTGVYQQFIKPKLDFEAKTLPLECTALLSLSEIVSITQTTLFLAYNVYWYWDNFNVKLKSGRNQYEVTLNLKRVENK